MIYDHHRAADGSIKQQPANLRAHEFLLLLLLLPITNLSPLSVLSPIFSSHLLLLLLKHCCSLFNLLLCFDALMLQVLDQMMVDIFLRPFLNLSLSSPLLPLCSFYLSSIFYSHPLSNTAALVYY